MKNYCATFGADPYILLKLVVEVLSSTIPRDRRGAIIDLYHRVVQNEGENDALQEYIQGYIDQFHDAVITGDMKSVKKHIVSRYPGLFDRHGNNALHNAVQYGQLEVVKYLTGCSEDPIKEDIVIHCDPTCGVIPGASHCQKACISARYNIATS